MKVLARCPLEPRRSVYVIEAAGRCFLIGVGDGPMTVLAELDAEKVRAASAASAAGPRFAEVLARVLRRPARAEASSDGAAVRRLAVAARCCWLPAVAHAAGAHAADTS